MKKMLKKVVKPRKCAKTFDTYCDLDQDRRLSRDEWAVCLGGDLSRIIKPPPGAYGVCVCVRACVLLSVYLSIASPVGFIPSFRPS